MFPKSIVALGMQLLTLAAFQISLAQQFEAQTRPNQQTLPKQQLELLAQKNLVAWCIVPFDAKKRTPEERARMLVELGITQCAYDWRDEHVPQFEEEIRQYRQHGIDFFAFWGQHDAAFALFEKYDLHPQVWQMIGDPGGEPASKAVRAAEKLIPLAQRTAKLKLPVGLYNHMGWDGQPENMVEVCKQLRQMGFDHVGIVYNFHHGHEHIAQWSEAIQLMLPYLICVNINGMNDDAQPKILGLGKGQHEKSMLQELIRSGYQGPIGIIDHRPELDARVALQENLDGLAELRQDLLPALDDIQSNKPREVIIDHAQVAQLVASARSRGHADRGAAVFGSDQTACISCHRLDSTNGQTLGGAIGPRLTELLSKRSMEQIVQALLWPNAEVDPQYQMWQVLTDTGSVYAGYRLNSTDDKVLIKQLNGPEVIELERSQVIEMSTVGSPMPAGVASLLSSQQLCDLIAFLQAIGKQGSVSEERMETIRLAQQHGPAKFPFNNEPIAAKCWPHYQQIVNRDRVYDFYTKQAEHFRQQTVAPLLLSEYPGLDGGAQGHWGNQNDKTWQDSRWNDTKLGSLQGGVFREGKLTVPRGLCVQLNELACCFDMDNLCYQAIWRGGFVSFSDFRHGFLDGLKKRSELVDNAGQWSQPKRGQYRGLHRLGKQVIFAYEIDGQLIWDAPTEVDGQFSSIIAPADSHPLRPQIIASGQRQWPEEVQTEIQLGRERPFAIDTVELPWENPWKALMFLGGHDFLPDGSALVCTIVGDVWRVSELQAGSQRAKWQRFASGLHHPLDLLIDEDGIFVQCRDQLVRLVDSNDDHEADYYECYSVAFETSAAGHDYICGLQRDRQGNFYTASGNQGLVKISADGRHAQVLATGFRNPDGLGLVNDQFITVPCSEGDWTPASMVCAVPLSTESQGKYPFHFGFRGPKQGRPPEVPLVYLPRGLDNSCGGQVVVPKNQWGSLAGHLLHLSFGVGGWFNILIDQVDGTLQGAVIPLSGDFRSGVHRGRFCRSDGHLYVSGTQGWGSYTVDDGCFQRIRFTGDAYQQPVSFHAHRNGILLRFAEPIDAQVATDTRQHFAQAWNYRYSGAYGSAEFSPSHPGVAGHDTLVITRAELIDAHTLFLEIPDIQPVNMLHLRMHVNREDQYPSVSPVGSGHDLFLTVHRLDADFTQYTGYQPIDKVIAAHPLLVDMAANAATMKNAWLNPIAEVELKVDIQAGKNLTYQQSELTVKSDQAVQLTFHNPDVVPHNWVLIQPGQLTVIGELSNRLIAKPESYARHYVPDSPQVIVHTDIVQPGQEQTIHFRAPIKPGQYPYLCTFPGHWMVMNGILIVQE